MDKRRTFLIVIAGLSAFVIAGFWLMFGTDILFSNTSMRKTDVRTMPEATAISSNIGAAGVVEQAFKCPCDTLSSLAVVFNRNAYVDNAQLVVELSDGYKSLASIVIPSNYVESQHRTFLYPSERLTGLKDKKLLLRIYTTTGIDSGMGVMYAQDGSSKFRVGNSIISGSICFAIEE